MRRRAPALECNGASGSGLPLRFRLSSRRAANAALRTFTSCFFVLAHASLLLGRLLLPHPLGESDSVPARALALELDQLRLVAQHGAQRSLPESSLPEGACSRGSRSWAELGRTRRLLCQTCQLQFLVDLVLLAPPFLGLNKYIKLLLFSYIYRWLQVLVARASPRDSSMIAPAYQVVRRWG